MSLVKKKDWYLDYLLIIVGTGLMALAINSVFDATGLVTGGFSGISILVKHWTGGIIDGGVPLWLTNITLNIPLFFLGWRIKGFSFVKKALVGEISLSTWLAIQPVWNIAGDDLLLAAVYGGVILGIGRIVGETAALMYTSGTVAKYAGAMESGRTLALHMYVLTSEALHVDQASATAVVLLIIVIGINAFSGFIAKKLAKKTGEE